MFYLQQARKEDISKIEAMLFKKIEELKLIGVEDQWSKTSVSWNTLQKVSQPHNYYFVNNEIEAIGMFCIVDEDKEYWPNDLAKTALYIHKIVVLNKASGTGASSFILDSFKQMGRDANLASVKLDVRAHSHKLRSIYERNGFQLLRIEDLPDGDQSALYEFKL